MKQPLRLPGFSGKIMLVASMALGLAVPALAQMPGAHVHGQAALEIVAEGGTVQLNLYSPLENLLGFEHAPRTVEERRSAQAMVAKLHQADSLFVFTPAARCRLESAGLSSAVLSPDLLAAPVSGKSQHAGADSPDAEASGVPAASSSPSPIPHSHDDAHAELEAAWVFHCSAPDALQELDVGLFRVFSGLKRLDVAMAGPRKQSSARLTPRSTRLKWR